MNLSNLGEMLSDLIPQPALAREGWIRTASFLMTGGLVSAAGQRLKRKRRLSGAIAEMGGRAVIGLGLFSLIFYRDPKRDPLGNDPNFIYAPADGKVIEISRNVDEPKFIGGPAHKITIASHLLDVHIQRAPMQGQVRYVFFETDIGKQRANYLGITTEHDGTERRVLLTQQTNSYNVLRLPEPLAETTPGSLQVWAGNRIEPSQKIGLAGFGQPTLSSLYLPADAPLDILCQVGQHVQAGMTVLARFRAS